MANPVEFNRKCKVLFYELRLGAAAGESGRLSGGTRNNSIAAGITNSYVYISPCTTDVSNTWEVSLKMFAQLLFR